MGQRRRSEHDEKIERHHRLNAAAELRKHRTLIKISDSDRAQKIGSSKQKNKILEFTTFSFSNRISSFMNQEEGEIFTYVCRHSSTNIYLYIF